MSLAACVSSNVSGFIYLIFTRGQHSGAVVSTVAALQEGPGFEFGSEPFSVEFACSPCVCVGSLQVLQLPPAQSWGRLIGNPKIARRCWLHSPVRTHGIFRAKYLSTSCASRSINETPALNLWPQAELILAPSAGFLLLCPTGLMRYLLVVDGRVKYSFYTIKVKKKKEN